MNREIEAKFLNIDVDQIRSKLKALGGHCEQPMRLMRRAMFDYPDKRFQNSIKGDAHSQRLRVRDEGNKVTVTYKKSNETNYSYETETTVGSYDDMCSIFKQIGLDIYSYQESKRETWKVDNVEVVIDEWPWIKPYIEIEGPDEASIKSVAIKLGLDWEDAAFGTVDTVYMSQYKKMVFSDSVGDLPEVKFSMPLPKYFKDRT